MRVIGKLDHESSARLFGDYLYSQGINNDVEPGGEGTWEVWVRSEDQLETSRRLLEEFRQRPQDPKYVKSLGVARQRREEERRQQKQAEKRYFDRDHVFPERYGGMGWLTVALVGLSLVVGLVSRGMFSDRDLNDRVIQPLSIAAYRGEAYRGGGPLPEIRGGQVWRLFTPILLHFGPLHLFFNMYWLLDLGTMIERRQGRWLFALLVLTIAAGSNLAQFMASGPAFGGMSGVVYGLLAYIWTRSRFDPGGGLSLHPTTVFTAMAWFFLCLFGVIGQTANTAHAVGLGLGALWGYVLAQWNLHRLS